MKYNPEFSCDSLQNTILHFMASFGLLAVNLQAQIFPVESEVNLTAC